MNIWPRHFNDAVAAHTTALHTGATLSGAERADAARTFRTWIDYFRSGGEQAISVLKTELYNSDFERSSAAAKLFIECGDLDDLIHFSENMSGLDGRIPRPDLKRLWIKISPSRAMYDEFAQSNAYEHHPLLQAMLCRPTPSAYELFRDLCDGTTWYGTLDQAIKAVAKWGDLSLLHNIMSTYFVEEDMRANWDGRDIRTKAAFYLGLNGDRRGIEFLIEMAHRPNPKQAIEACYYLGQLALPEAIVPTMQLFASDDRGVTAQAMNIAANLGLPGFISPLCDIASRKRIMPENDGETPLCDEAIRAITHIIGKPLEDLDEEYIVPSVDAGTYGEGEFTEVFRQQAIDVSKIAMQNMDSAKRYYRGELLTLSHLAADLLSPHHGPMNRAAHGLLAITGEDFGFDPDDDLIVNLPSIEAWQQRAKRPEPLVPGGWAFWGTPLPNPTQ